MFSKYTMWKVICYELVFIITHLAIHTFIIAENNSCKITAEQLAMPQIRWRSKNGLTSNIISKIQIVTSNKGKDNSGSNDPPNEPGSCKICLDGIKGQNYKTKKNKISRIVSFCMKCKEHCCKKHSVWVCKNCSQ